MQGHQHSVESSARTPGAGPLHHGHSHGGLGAGRRVLGYALLVTLLFAVVEGVSGWWAGSLALLGDAGHMVTDASALGLALLAAWMARRPASARHSYGLGRAEVVVALFNGVLMLAIIAGIGIAALQRLHSPTPVAAVPVMVVASLGLLVNLAVAGLLRQGEQTLNLRAAMLHVMADLLGSVAALVAGVVIYFSGWTAIDPILSLFICLLILYSAVHLIREALHVIMEGVPLGLDLPEIGRALATVNGVHSVHDLHIWTLSSGVVSLSAHIMVSDLAHWEETLAGLRVLLHDRYGIEHVTLQPEPTTHILRPLKYPGG